MNKFQSKRFTLVIMSFVIISFACTWAVVSKQEAVAVAAVAVLGGIITWYLNQETKRPSIKEPIKETPAGHSDR